jgi:flavin reductase (DIM6/NTAB) family NADH-FMN oxidoreductase RutF
VRSGRCPCLGAPDANLPYVTFGPSTDDFRDAVSRFATGIAVVTCRVAGVDHAMTANSFTSVSLDPLLVLVCVERDTRFHEAIVATDGWAVSILPRSAESVSRWLATRGRPLHGQLDRVPHGRGETTGAPLITTALATLECRTQAMFPGGDHNIVIGEVVATAVNSGGPESDDAEGAAPDPLLYYRRGYRSIRIP